MGGLRAARLNAIKEDMPGLSVAALAGRHGYTPRYVQRLFETEGTTFTEYVVGRRVARAHRLLTDPHHHSPKRASVTGTARSAAAANGLETMIRADAARLLKDSISTVQRMERDGRLPKEDHR